MNNEFCNECNFKKMYWDPDPNDSIDVKNLAVMCLRRKTALGFSLSSEEAKQIKKPYYCPYLGRELSRDEKADAYDQLIKGMNDFDITGIPVNPDILKK